MFLQQISRRLEAVRALRTLSTRLMSSEQLFLPSLPTPQRRSDSLFFGIIPDSGTATSVHQRSWDLRAEHGLHGKPVEATRLHVTLHFIGDFAGIPADVVRGASLAAAATASSVSPFVMTFDQAMTFSRSSRNRPFVLSCRQVSTGLLDLHRRLADALTQHRVHLQKSSFKPHMTLLYDDKAVAEHAIAPVTWQVNEFVLVHSLVGQTKHIPLARWSLQG